MRQQDREVKKRNETIAIIDKKKGRYETHLEPQSVQK